MTDYAFKISIAEGLHARPSAKLVQLLKPFTPLSFYSKGKEVDTLSVLELLLLKINYGECITIRTSVPLPVSVLNELEELLGEYNLL